MKTFLTSILCLLLFSQNGFSQKEKTSHFLAKCLVPESGEKSDFQIPNWAASEDILMLNSMKEQIQVTPNSTKWVKKKADRECLSANPDDCLVWCLVEVPETYKTTKSEWKDVSKKAFLPEKALIQEFLKNGYSLDWRKTIDPKNLSSEDTEKIISELKGEGYLNENFKGIFYSEVKAALLNLQADFGLPIGNLNFETLDFLEIEYENFNVAKNTDRPRRNFPKYQLSPAPDPSEFESDKCYAKCFMTDEWEDEIYELPIYIGNPTDKTVKRKSKMIGDQEFMLVKNPKKVDPKFIEWKTITETVLVKKGGFTEWREILCQSRVTAQIIVDIQNALSLAGFHVDKTLSDLSGETKEALKIFQREHGLPVGNLDIDTLDALNIDY